VTIVVAGETVIDLAPAGGGLWAAHPGGGPANTAVALARLGSSASMLARISCDPFGLLLRERLSKNGVDLSFVVSAAEPATLAVVGFDDAGSASYSFYIDGTSDWQWSESELPASLDSSVLALHAGSMALVRLPGGAVLESLLTRESANRVISIDPNVRAAVCPDHVEYAAHIERWLGIAHVFKASSDDVEWLYPGRSIEDALADWSSRGPAVVVLTLGRDGAIAQLPGGVVVRVGGQPVDVVDTIGAGDTFSAALLHHLSEAGLLDAATFASISASQVEAALHFGVRAASITCSRAGADPPYAAELTP
jgi:fructokinase